MNDYMNVIKNHYADFKGRSRRREFWMFSLIHTLITFVLAMGASVLGPAMGDNQVGTLIFGIPLVLYTLGTLVPGIAVTVRRLHDNGRSGWWYLLNVIPYVGSVVLLIFLVLDSQPGSNKWGPNPKEHGGVAAAPSW